MAIIHTTKKGFKISRSHENCEDVFRVYHEATRTKIWYKCKSESKAKAYVREMEALMENDSGEIDPKVKIG